MNINRNNYEELFLLYIDNELSATEKIAVELFVEENEDLKNELIALQQTVLKPSAAKFQNKSSLLKDDFAAIQQNLLLYIDDELNATDKINVEKQIQINHTTAKELAILQKTKLQFDTAIVFPNKKLLYKKESGKIITMPWLRISAAAVLIGFGIWGAFTLVNNNASTTSVNVATNPSTPIIKNNTIGDSSKEQKNDFTVTDNANTTNIAEQEQTLEKTDAQQDKINNASESKETLPTNSFTQKNNEPLIAAQKVITKPSNNLPTPDYENINIQKSNTTAMATVSPENNAADKINSGNKIAVALNNPVDKIVNGYALNTSYTQSKPQEVANNDKVLYLDEDDVKKTKLGGFFKRVKRVVERNTNIKTGNSLKVAGFDIAIK